MTLEIATKQRMFFMLNHHPSIAVIFLMSPHRPVSALPWNTFAQRFIRMPCTGILQLPPVLKCFLETLYACCATLTFRALSHSDLALLLRKTFSKLTPSKNNKKPKHIFSQRRNRTAPWQVCITSANVLVQKACKRYTLHKTHVIYLGMATQSVN